jgi:hypothetical protein
MLARGGWMIKPECQVFCNRAYEAMNMIRKGQIKGVKKEDVMGQISFINEIFGVAA